MLNTYMADVVIGGIKMVCRVSSNGMLRMNDLYRKVLGPAKIPTPSPFHPPNWVRTHKVIYESAMGRNGGTFIGEDSAELYVKELLEWRKSNGKRTLGGIGV